MYSIRLAGKSIYAYVAALAALPFVGSSYDDLFFMREEESAQYRVGCKRVSQHSGRPRYGHRGMVHTSMARSSHAGNWALSVSKQARG